METVINVSGMSCGGCARSIEAILNALPGVATQASYADWRATVTHPDQVDGERLAEVVRAKGYGAEVEESNDDPAEKTGADLHVAIIGLAHQAVRLGREEFVAQQTRRVDELRQMKCQDILDSTQGLTLLQGQARFEDGHMLVIEGEQGLKHLRPDRILVATTGASAAVPPIPGLAGTPYWTSTEALFSTELPEHLLVIGGSFVACELAQTFRRMGSRVTMLVRSTLLSQEDPALGDGLQAAFEAEGIRVLTHTEASRVDHQEGEFWLEMRRGRISGDRLLIATGRVANTQSLNLAAAQVETNSQGGILIDTRMRTNVPLIYAAGDCTTQPQLVYVAAAAGGRAGANMTGGSEVLDLDIVPAVVFTDPHVATVGLNEQRADRQGLQVESRTLDLEMVPRALANFDTRGFIKLVADKQSGRLVGAQVLAHEGGEIIQIAAMAIALSDSLWSSWGRCSFPT